MEASLVVSVVPALNCFKTGKPKCVDVQGFDGSVVINCASVSISITF